MEKIKICCDKMREECTSSGMIKRGFTLEKIETKEGINWKRIDIVRIVAWDDEYPTYDEILTITYCPFCGKKI